MTPPTIDHAVVFCHDCGDNYMGIIRNGAKAECAKCHGYNTGPADLRRAWVVIERRRAARERKAEVKRA